MYRHRRSFAFITSALIVIAYILSSPTIIYTNAQLLLGGLASRLVYTAAMEIAASDLNAGLYPQYLPSGYTVKMLANVTQCNP